MKCSECQASDQRSTVYEKGTVVTDMYAAPYWDEDGVYHVHDPNTRTTTYWCSNGHEWSESSRGICPAGDYS